MFKYLITIIILKLLDENLMERTKAGKIVIDIKNQDYLELPISVLDERYTMQDFSYVVDINFKSLQNAVNAENYIMTKYKEILENYQVPFSDPAITEVRLSSVEQFFSDIANLINLNSDSVVAQKEKILDLERQIEIKDSESIDVDSVVQIHLAVTSGTVCRHLFVRRIKFATGK